MQKSTRILHFRSGECPESDFPSRRKGCKSLPFAFFSRLRNRRKNYFDFFTSVKRSLEETKFAERMAVEMEARGNDRLGVFAPSVTTVACT